jgi:hypothetical protein
LAPCCMPRRVRGSDVDRVRIMLRENKWDGYAYWCLGLFNQLPVYASLCSQSSSAKSQQLTNMRRNLITDQNMLSEKHNFLCCYKLELANL